MMIDDDDDHGIITITIITGIITALLGSTFDEIIPEGGIHKVISLSDILDAIAAVPKQYAADCRVSLLAPFVFGFGISTAMFAYYVNR